MKKKFPLLFLTFLLVFTKMYAQTTANFTTCSQADIEARMQQVHPEAAKEMAQNEAFIQARVAELQAQRAAGNPKGDFTYIIPVVLHVFHNGEDARLDMEQLQSGLDVINTDYNALNTDWNEVDPAFEGVKSKMQIELCLATIDPDGNPTSGVVYYDNEAAMLNQIDLPQYAWDNYKYLNIYLPKYTNGEPSVFTAYANFPSTALADANRGGITYSSIRWGYGALSELEEGQEWASVGTHEMGHWLDLRHTFQGSCSTTGDGVADTPPTTGGIIFLEGCYNNDLSCGVATNGSNYMDYNHDCKRMFTQGQVDRMTAAMELPSRITLWSEENLAATGCMPLVNTQTLEETQLVKIWPNPSSDWVRFRFAALPTSLSIYDAQGRLLEQQAIATDETSLNLSRYPVGLYFYRAQFADGRAGVGRLVLE